MRKNKAFICAVLILTGTLYGCGSSGSHSENPGIVTQTETQASVSETEAPVAETEIEVTTTTAVETTTVTEKTTIEEEPVNIQTDSSAAVTASSDGFDVVFGDNICKLKLPASWANRFAIENNTVYNKKNLDSSDHQFGDLFGIVLYSDEDMQSLPPSGYILGTADDKYVLLLTPTDLRFDINNTSLTEDYQSMYEDIQSIVSTAECKSSKGFKPIDICNYDQPYFSSTDVSGTWENGMQAVQFAPYICFRPRDNAFGYAYALNGAGVKYASGHYFINTAAENYEWNTDNWGEFGIIFLDGGIYSFTVYYSAPATISIEKLGGRSDYDEIADASWMWSSDFQDFDANYND